MVIFWLKGSRQSKSVTEGRMAIQEILTMYFLSSSGKLQSPYFPWFICSGSSRVIRLFNFLSELFGYKTFLTNLSKYTVSCHWQWKRFGNNNTALHMVCLQKIIVECWIFFYQISSAVICINFRSPFFIMEVVSLLWPSEVTVAQMFSVISLFFKRPVSSAARF